MWSLGNCDKRAVLCDAVIDALTPATAVGHTEIRTFFRSSFRPICSGHQCEACAWWLKAIVAPRDVITGTAMVFTHSGTASSQS